MMYQTRSRDAAALLALVLAACSAQSLRAGPPRATEAAPPAYGQLLARYATPDGVRYAAWHRSGDDLEKLGDVVGFYANTRPPEDRDASLAWHLNAYNSWILHRIMEKYPTRGPLDGDRRFFQEDRITISGERMSFDHLEKEIIGPGFREPRIHFALNCASVSCPPLDTRPFSAATLHDDLDRLTRAFINRNPQGVGVRGDRVELSKIFEWYADDFGGRDQLITYINRYRDDPVPPAAGIRFLEYSWNLNETR